MCFLSHPYHGIEPLGMGLKLAVKLVKGVRNVPREAPLQQRRLFSLTHKWVR